MITTTPIVALARSEGLLKLEVASFGVTVLRTIKYSDLYWGPRLYGKCQVLLLLDLLVGH